MTASARLLVNAYELAAGMITAAEFLHDADTLLDERHDYSSDEWRAVGERMDQLADVNETRMETLLRLMKRPNV